MVLDTRIANMQAVREKIAEAGSSIEDITGTFAQQMLIQAGLEDYPREKPLVVSDNLCREGILTVKLQEMFKERPQDTFEVICGEINQTMIDIFKQRIAKEGWTNITFTELTPGDTHMPSDHCTHIFANFALILSPNPANGLAELLRTLRPGGTVGITSWENCAWYPDLQKAMASVPDLPKLPEPAEMETVLPNIFSSEKIWHDPEAVRNFVTQQGFVNVNSRLASTTSVVRDMEELRKLVRPPMTLLTRFYWTQEQRDSLDNSETFEKICSWFEEKLKREGSIVWEWGAVVTTANKPV